MADICRECGKNYDDLNHVISGQDCLRKQLAAAAEQLAQVVAKLREDAEQQLADKEQELETLQQGLSHIGFKKLQTKLAAANAVVDLMAKADKLDDDFQTALNDSKKTEDEINTIEDKRDLAVATAMDAAKTHKLQGGS